MPPHIYVANNEFANKLSQFHIPFTFWGDRPILKSLLQKNDMHVILMGNPFFKSAFDVPEDAEILLAVESSDERVLQLILHVLDPFSNRELDEIALEYVHNLYRPAVAVNVKNS